MGETPQKKVDESWKEQAEREKQAPPASGPSAQPGGPAAGGATARTAGQPGTQEGHQAQFDLFVSGLAMEALIALGDIPHPTTKKQGTNLVQAKYIVDLLGIIEEKTKGNLTVEEEKMLTDVLYQLRTRYLTKAGD